MPKRSAGTAAEVARRKRVAAPAFQRRLRVAIASDLRALGARRLKDVVPGAALRHRLRSWTAEALASPALADLLIAANRRLERRLRQQHRSVRQLLGSGIGGDVDLLLDSLATLPPSTQDLLARLMDQEFFQRLLTDLIFTAIEGFNRRVNPLFGSATTFMLEDQIKGFIRLFMPTLQRQAVAFVTSRGNQRLAVDLLRAVSRQLLAEPLSRYALVLPESSRGRLEAAVRQSLRSEAVQTAVANAVVSAFDDLFAEIGTRRLADLVDLERASSFLADGAATALSAFPALAAAVADARSR